MILKQPALRVAKPPARPLMVYDGDCNFCRFWIVRWEHATAGRVDYVASQEVRVAEQFPELSRERFAESVQLIETDGQVYSGAEAVFRSLAMNPRMGWLLWLYRDAPGFAPVSEWAYRFVAQRRTAFSFLTKLLWGRDATLPAYSRVRRAFLGSLGFIYLVAFVSLGSQLSGLVGSRGILPAARTMELLRLNADQNQVGWERYHQVPTLCWLNASDGFLKFLWVAGAALSVLVMANVAPAPCLFLLWLIYLSLSCVCREFLGFQWDVLLLETGFVAIFLAPLTLLPGRAAAAPSRIALWLLRWLLFRLMFESGLVKLASGDAMWRNLTALNIHYETQPLPTWIGWYAHQLPGGVQHASVFVMFIIELGVPFLIFGPRRVRFAATVLLVFLQVLILLTGNYCFFNLLTFALCLTLLDDAALARFVPAKWRERLAAKRTKPAETKSVGWPVWATAPVGIVILLVTVTQLVGMMGWIRTWPPGLASVQQWLAPFRSVNTYGLFAVMTTTRPEIIVEGSNDGQTWLAYEFKYKPGDLKRRPGFVAPHQPRVDWQMWFAALDGSPLQERLQRNAWLVHFSVRILQGSPPVLELLEKNPFPDAPPRYLRARVFEYHFTNYEERRRDGNWWRRELKGEYLPAFTLQDVGVAN